MTLGQDRLAVVENDIADIDVDVTQLCVALNILRARVSLLEIANRSNSDRIAELEHELGMDG